MTQAKAIQTANTFFIASSWTHKIRRSLPIPCIVLHGPHLLLTFVSWPKPTPLPSFFPQTPTACCGCVNLAWRQRCLRSTPARWTARALAVGTSWNLKAEKALKRWDAMPHLFDAFQAHGLTRSSLVLTCGGGALSDAVGLAAAVWKRGLRVAHMPTTTLAMVDAAWGGKTGINWRGSKNQLGTFTLPEFVHLDARWLVTLPDRERRAGLAEVAKHAMLHAHLGQAHLEDWPSWDTSSDALEAWTAKLEKSAQSKMSVVDADLHERGARAQLNLGHTVGHAVEAHFAATAHPWLHGEAVALGLRFVLFQAPRPLARGLPVFGPLACDPRAPARHTLGAMA